MEKLKKVLWFISVPPAIIVFWGFISTAVYYSEIATSIIEIAGHVNEEGYTGLQVHTIDHKHLNILWDKHKAEWDSFYNNHPATQ